MSKFSINYSNLENVVYKKAYKLSDVQDKIEKVGFDLVKFKDHDKNADLWQVQQAEDGQYIVALYQQDEEKTASDWDVKANKVANALEIWYKGDPIVRIATSKLGIPPAELDKVEAYLPNKLAENKKLVKSLLNELNESTKKQVLNKYPELI